MESNLWMTRFRLHYIAYNAEKRKEHKSYFITTEVMDQLTRASSGAIERLIVLCPLVLKVLQLSVNHFVVTKIENVATGTHHFFFFFENWKLSRLSKVRS